MENYHDLNNSFDKVIDRECSSAVEAEAFPDAEHDDDSPAATVSGANRLSAPIESSNRFLKRKFEPKLHVYL